MVKVLGRGFTDEESQALIGLPTGWTWCRLELQGAFDGYYVSRTDGIWTETFKALGPFDTIPEMVEAADREERRTRQEVEQ